MWPKLGNTKEEKEEKKTIAQIVAGDDLCIACGWPAEVFGIDDDSSFCLECYYSAAKAAATAKPCT